MAQPTPVVGYWNIRGLAQPIRMLLVYAEEPYVDKKYAYGPAPDFDRSDWLNKKDEFGFDFPNLPYLIDGKVKITQSIAILRYVARKHKLEPDNEEDRIRSDILEQQVCDIRNTFVRMCYNPDFEKLKEEYLKTLPNNLKGISDFLGKRNWFASEERPTYVDFMVHELLDTHRYLDPDCLKDFGNLTAFIDRLEELPTIKRYMASTDYMKFPLNGDMAVFGSRSSKK